MRTATEITLCQRTTNHWFEFRARDNCAQFLVTRKRTVYLSKIPLIQDRHELNAQFTSFSSNLRVPLMLMILIWKFITMWKTMHVIILNSEMPTLSNLENSLIGLDIFRLTVSIQLPPAVCYGNGAHQWNTYGPWYLCIHRTYIH